MRPTPEAHTRPYKYQWYETMSKNLHAEAAILGIAADKASYEASYPCKDHVLFVLSRQLTRSRFHESLGSKSIVGCR